MSTALTVCREKLSFALFVGSFISTPSESGKDPVRMELPNDQQMNSAFANKFHFLRP